MIDMLWGRIGAPWRDQNGWGKYAGGSHAFTTVPVMHIIKANPFIQLEMIMCLSHANQIN